MSQNLLYFFFFFAFEGSTLGIWRFSEQQLLPTATATAIQDPSFICELHHSSRECQILNSLSEARDQICVLMDNSQVPKPLSYDENSENRFFFFFFPMIK